MSTEKKIRTAVVGVGIGRLHIEGYKKHKDAELVAVADINEERAKATAEEFEIPHVYADYEKMLKELDLDAVSVCTPNKLHTPVTVAAFEAGCHVLCEKPIAMNAVDGQKMVDAGKKAGKTFMMAFNNRFRGDTQVLKSFIDNGTLGDIYYAKCGWTRRRGIPGFGGWFTTKELSGGGPLIDIGVHVLDLTLYLMGNPKPVSVFGSTYAKFGPKMPGGEKYDVEDLGTGMIKFDNGATVFVEASWASNIANDQFYSTLLGDKGGADLDPLRIYTEMNGTQVDIAPQFPGIHGHQAEVFHFVECLRDGKTPLATGEHGLDVVKILDALYESSETGKMVTCA